MALLTAEPRNRWLIALARGLDLVYPQAQSVSAPALAAPGVVKSDAELVARHLSGDPHAFSELVKRYTRAIYNVTYRYTGNVQEAENLTQETFLRAWNALPHVGLDRPLKPYFIKIALNLCRDWAEHVKAEQVQPLDDADDAAIPEIESDPVAELGTTELRERVRAQLDALSPMYRAVLTLRYTEEMSYEEMAAALDLPVNTVRTHLHRARAKLRAMIESEPAR